MSQESCNGYLISIQLGELGQDKEHFIIWNQVRMVSKSYLQAGCTGNVI